MDEALPRPLRPSGWDVELLRSCTELQCFQTRNNRLANRAKDFTEVDYNVTRHITDELKNDDWSTMILHYLGLDHIGHKGGPRRSGFWVPSEGISEQC